MVGQRGVVMVEDALRELDGFASRDELLERRCWPEMIDLSLYYRRIVRVRRGWYALPSVDARIVTALRVGGRLACVSALAFYSDAVDPGPVHVVVPYGASHLDRGDAIVHWTRRPIAGRLVVTPEAAAKQARYCRARPTA
ncbi:hypothetical protein BH11ACT4_BH11ACT4_08970 [soil metagenome]